jgi:serine/threonine protein kinase
MVVARLAQNDPARARDPKAIADLALAAAIRGTSDSIYIEPAPVAPHAVDDLYAITLERGGAVISTTPIDAQLGAAVVARLAFLANLDLAAAHSSSGVVHVRSGDRLADVVVTVRPGATLRADLMVVRQRGARPAITPIGLVTGEVVGQYRIRERLGEGGMGTVFRVEHVTLDRVYALKALRAEVVERDPNAADQFLREARSAARIHHPNIVDVFDFGHLPDGRPYFVMELLEGESLADRVDRGAFQVADVVSVARQLAAALAAAHDRGVIHADVTPSNAHVIERLDAEGDHLDCKLVDFGLAKLRGDTMPDDVPEFVLGTPAYISPEQLRGVTATERSDQYGLGCVLFELLTGHPPYVHENIREQCQMHLAAPIPAIVSPHGPLPPKLADAITTLLQKTPAARFPGMHALIAALDDIERITDRRGWRRWLSNG